MIKKALEDIYKSAFENSIPNDPHLFEQSGGDAVLQSAILMGIMLVSLLGIGYIVYKLFTIILPEILTTRYPIFLNARVFMLGK